MSLKRRSWTVMEVGLAWALWLAALAGLCLWAEVSPGTVMAQGAPMAAIALTQVTDTVYRADGTAATGTVLVSWPAFTNAAGSNVPAGSTSVTIGAGGVLSVGLVPNAGSTPMGSYYTVVYHLDDGSLTREYWVVPVSANGVKVSTIKSTVLPASVAMQTVSKSYVDTAIATAVAGHPLDSSPYVVKAGDTMTGPLVLPGNPTAPLQASDKGYVDQQVAAVSAGQAQKVSTLPTGTQTVVQPTGTELAVNLLNGAEYASQFATGSGNNGIANATASPDCGNGCDVVVEQNYAPGEAVTAQELTDRTHVDDLRFGARRDTFRNPTSPGGQNSAESINLTSTESTQAIHVANGAENVFSTGLVIVSAAQAGGSNVFPQDVQGTVPYFKTTYSAMNVTGTNNTLGQHVLDARQQNCYGVGDCLMGGMFMKASGGFRDSADEGSHPFDLQFSEDQQVFEATCATGCTPGATMLQLSVTAAGGTQGEGRYLLDTNPAKVITGATLTGGTASGVRQPTAAFTGTNFPVSVLLETAQIIPTQANNIAPGTVTVPIVTSGAPAGFATNTAALPANSGVACVADIAVGDGRPMYFETAAYTVVDGSHVQLTLIRPHAAGATVAVGGLCGYGLEQTVDTYGNVRQVFPVIGSDSPTELLYAGGQSPLIGTQGLQSAFTNVNGVIAAIARTGGVVTVTFAGGLPVDVNGLTLTIAGVTDTSYNGSYVVTTTSPNMLTYAQAGADSTSSGGTASLVTGGFALYPMAEVLSVYNAATKAVDGQVVLSANTVNWAAGDTVEQPHYFQEAVSADTEFITQFTPRPSRNQSAGISYQGNNGPGLKGWLIENDSAAGSYFGNGGTHTAPSVAMQVAGVWRNSLEVQAGENAVLAVHCNSHGCDRYDSAYDLFQMDTSAGQDREGYSPATSTLTFALRGTQYIFNPQGLTAGTINVGTLNATTIHGMVAAGSLPVFGASGLAHDAGAVPDPGGLAGSTRYLREDGVWSAPAGGTGVAAGIAPVNLPQRANLLAEYLLNEGTGATAHDTSGRGNDGSIVGAMWDATQDLSFAGTGQYVQLPAALNAAQAWQFAIYNPVYGSAASPQAPGYGQPAAAGQAPALLCGTDAQHVCTMANSYRAGNAERFDFYGTDNTEAAEALPSGWHVVTLLCGARLGPHQSAKSHILYDGAEVGSYVVQGSVSTCPVPTAGNYQIGGSAVYGGNWFAGKVGAAWAWSTTLNLSDGAAAARSAMSYVRAKGVTTDFRAVTNDAPVIVAGLDSRTAGTGWLAQMTLTDASYGRVNLGFSGQEVFDACPQFDLTYGLQMGAASAPAITILWGGGNDLNFGGRTPRQVANDLRCMVRKARAAGSWVVLGTEISALSASGTTGDANKNALNAILRAEAASWGVDNLADLATDVHLGADGASANTSCFADGVNPAAACEPYVTAVMQDAVNELLGSTESNRHTTAAASYQEVAGDRYLDLTGGSAQAVTLPDCTGYTLPRQIVNLSGIAGTVSAVSGQLLTGSGVLGVGSKAMFVAVPGSLSAAGCSWERTQ